MSGQPGIERTFFLNRHPRRCRQLRISRSGTVSELRTRDITQLRCSGVN